MRSRVLVLVLVLSCLLACTRGEPRTDAPGASAVPLAASATPPSERGATTVLDFLSGSERCIFGHRGFLLDLGDPAMRARSSGGKYVLTEIETHEHEGATWAGIQARSLEMRFVSTADTSPESGLVVEARVRGGAGRGAAVYLNGKALGNLSFPKGETKIAQLRAPNVTIQRGPNDLVLRFTGASAKGHDELAQIDWIRVGPADGDAPYAAPSRNDAIATVNVAGVSRRGVSLRSPGFARCSGQIPKGAVLEGWVAASGGEGEAEVRMVVDRAEPRVVAALHLGGPLDPPGWRPLAIPLGDVATLGAIELVAKSSSKGARIVFAEPRVVRTGAAPAVTPSAKSAILVVLGTVARRQLAIHGGPIATPELAELGAQGLVFEAHRGTSNLASGALASMLTGQLPRVHGVDEPDAALPEDVLTIAEAMRQGGIVTGMFTANPTTSAPFGFARGFETFMPRSPIEDAAATAVFDDAAHWIESHKDARFLAVVHARGGHPPWDTPTEETKDLAPAGYAGSLEPKHAGESLAKARRVSRLFADADRERAYALQARAVATHDAALGKLLAQLKSLGRDKDTLVIVTGDIGVDAAAHVPFLEEDPLEEAALAIPLVVRAPGGPKGRVSAPTSSVDVARTILETLGLPPAPKVRGEALWSVASHPADGPERPLFAASASRFSVRWGGFVLVGAKDREVRLCNLALDPDCVSDVRATHPFASELMHGVAFEELVKKEPRVPSPRYAADEKLPAALRAWGR